MSYTNEEYYEMVRVYLCNKTISAARTMYENESVRRLRAQGFKNPTVPRGATILAANQRLRDYGQFSTPSHASGKGGTRMKVNVEDKIIEFFEQHPTASTRDAARRFGVSQRTIWNMLKLDTRLDSDQDSDSELLVFNQAVGDEQPSTSAGEELQYQASRYSMLSGNDGNQSALEEIIIKEEITDEERYQCRLCLSVGRKMQELGEYAPLYRKLLFENNYQNTTIPSFMYQMLACWECHAELRKVKRFQDKVRRANNAFETSQNQKCENLSNLSTILIGEYKNSQPGGTDQPSSVEDCAQGIKEEAVEVEVEETALPDPLEVSQVKPSDQEFDINLEIQKETNPSVSTEKVAKRTIPEQTPNILKRAKLDQTVPKPGPKRAKLDQSGQKPAQEEESEPKSTPESDADAIFGKVKIEIDELQKILQERRNKESFKSMKFKCDSCVLGFTDHNRLLEHNKNFHDEEVGTCECDICERRFDDEDQLSAHHRNHFVKFVCKLCNFECYTKTGRAIHFKRHKGALQGTSLEDLLKKKLTSNQRASASGSSHKTST
ncbi:uncharacterized protein [Maniola hyperantus]|uniref:uncharacterized protein isoform X11 n=1 Tax=Aphantopus hyperantus TaxID=2795564 RepID=UPI00374A0278